MTVASELIARLREHYLPPTEQFKGGLFAHEVGENGTASRQRCDALYVGFTAASGRIMVGHEVKISRADWRHELDQPRKADRWHDACHAWYVVAPSTAIVPPEEVPAGWGLLVPNPRSRRRFTTVVKAAVKGEDHAPPWWATRSFMARVDTLRHGEISALAAAVEANLVEQARGTGWIRSDELRQLIDERVEQRASQLSGGDPRTKRLVEAFTDRGVKLAQWSAQPGEDVVTPDMLADADVRALLRSADDLDEKRRSIVGRYGMHQIERIVADATALREACRELVPAESGEAGR